MAEGLQALLVIGVSQSLGAENTAVQAFGSKARAGFRVGSAAVVGEVRLSAGVAFGALELSSEGLDHCEDVELSLGRILAYDCL